MSTNTALDQIKSRVEGHTEGPWRVWKHGSGPRDSGVETTWAYEGDEPKQITDWCFPADAELIAAAPKLLAALEAVEAVMQRLEESGKISNPSNRYDSGISSGFTIAADAIHTAIEEALR